MLCVKQLCKAFTSFAIKEVSFEARQGGYFVLLGKTGVGKSILLETIAGLIRPDAGQILLDGKDITSERIQNRKIGMVFQNSTLFPHMTVYDNIAYPLRCKRTKTEIRKRVVGLAEDFGFTHLLAARPRTLSGGESQRVCLARAIASEPLCLLLDEPISALDAESRPQMRALLRKISANGRQTIVHVTHDYTEAVSLGTHIAVMEAGKIAQAGTTGEIFQHPKSEFIARFVGIRNFFKGRLCEPLRDKANPRRFTAGGLSFSVLTDSPPGLGCIMVRSEDITICNGISPTSARNNFEGTIVDIIPAGIGVEIIVDIGVEVAALITAEAVTAMGLHRGKKVWISFKASAVKYVEQ